MTKHSLYLSKTYSMRIFILLIACTLFKIGTSVILIGGIYILSLNFKGSKYTIPLLVPKYKIPSSSLKNAPELNSLETKPSFWS